MFCDVSLATFSAGVNRDVCLRDPLPEHRKNLNDVKNLERWSLEFINGPLRTVGWFGEPGSSRGERGPKLVW